MRISSCAFLINSALAKGGKWAKGLNVLAPFVAMLFLTLVPFQAYAATKADLDHKKWSAWAELGGYYNSDSTNELEIELFLPIAQSAFALVFVDLEGEIFQDDMKDGAFALGFRQMFSNGWNLGIWGGPEVRHTEAGNRFWRFTAGLEMLHPDYDVRFNGYAPFTNPQSSPSLAQVVLQGDQIFMTGAAEVALWGFDGEVGVRVPLEMAGLNPNDVELRLYGGGFYFDDDWVLEEIAGPKARVELRLYDVVPSVVGSRLTAEYEYSYDDVRGDRHQVGVRFRIPFGSGAHRSLVAAAPGSKGLALQPSQPLNRQERRMLEGLEREDIFTTPSGPELVADEHTDVVFEKVAYVGDNGDLSGTSAAQGANTLIIVNGKVKTKDGNNTIEGFQTVQGGGSTIPVYGVRTGTVAHFTAPGKRPTVISTDNSDVIALLGNRTHIAGLEIDGDERGGHGINVGSDKWNIALDQNFIHDVAKDGIYLGWGNEHVWIFNDVITNVGGAGIHIFDWNMDIRIKDVEIRNVDGTGIVIEYGNTVTVSDTTIADVGGDGIHIDSDINSENHVDIANVTITNIGQDGIVIGDRNIVTVSGTTIADVGDDGIDMGGNNVVEISNSTFEGTFGDSVIQIIVGGNDLSGDGNVFNGTFGHQFCDVTDTQNQGRLDFAGGINCPNAS